MVDGIKTMLNLAIRWGYLRDNPVKFVNPLKTDDKKPVRFLTLAECEKLLDSASSELYPNLPPPQGEESDPLSSASDRSSINCVKADGSSSGLAYLLSCCSTCP